jgi:hypothetical protein
MNPTSQSRFGLAVKIVQLEANINFKSHTVSSGNELRQELKEAKDEFKRK